ncbi:hypothetical protein H6P81_007671 [Aristolochia fimbriata]|uniref:Uncharacterized protein n=1 Tax=Aristolochia fimbriata TaxID=158543 RepID=A0AAV7F489_ARIFI|nr:hypothetical protein H6P81_007671 [Aristolochia fimbriata]
MTWMGHVIKNGDEQRPVDVRKHGKLAQDKELRGSREEERRKEGRRTSGKQLELKCARCAFALTYATGRIESVRCNVAAASWSGKDSYFLHQKPPQYRSM